MYTNTHPGQSCFNGAGPRMGALGAGAAGPVRRSQLLAQKVQLSHPLRSGFPSPQPTVGGLGHIARWNNSSPLNRAVLRAVTRTVLRNPLRKQQAAPLSSSYRQSKPALETGHTVKNWRARDSNPSRFHSRSSLLILGRTPVEGVGVGRAGGARHQPPLSTP